jgi:hypothetical protein
MGRQDTLFFGLGDVSSWADDVYCGFYFLFFIGFRAQRTISIMLNATRSFELCPAPFKNCRRTLARSCMYFKGTYLCFAENLTSCLI